MKWKQFLTPVSSITGQEAKDLVKAAEPGEVLFLDVRQPKEYNRSHLPGAKLIPVGELDQRVNELDPNRPTVIY